MSWPMQQDTVNDSVEHIVTDATSVAACCDVRLMTILAQRFTHVLYALPQRMGSRKVSAYEE